MAVVRPKAEEVQTDFHRANAMWKKSGCFLVCLLTKLIAKRDVPVWVWLILFYQQFLW